MNASASESGPKKVLIVDDDAAFAESISDLLEAFGYQVSAAPDGHSGLAMAVEDPPDLMILDLMMATDTEGFDVARKIPDKPELANMAVLMVTGAVRALNLPCRIEPDKTWLPVDRVMEKPIDPARLVAEVERLIETKTGGTPNERQEDTAG